MPIQHSIWIRNTIDTEPNAYLNLYVSELGLSHEEIEIEEQKIQQISAPLLLYNFPTLKIYNCVRFPLYVFVM